MTGISIETSLELWASSLRAVKARIAPLFTQERVAASAGSTCRFRVRSGGTSSSNAKLIADLGSATTGIRIGDPAALQVLTKNSDCCNFRLLQQYLPIGDIEHLGSAHVETRPSPVSQIIGPGKKHLILMVSNSY